MTPDAAGIEAALAEVLAGERCRDVHGDAYTASWCWSCRGWAAHVAAALLPVVTQAQAEAWERGNNDGLTFAAAPQKSLLTNPYRARADESGAS